MVSSELLLANLLHKFDWKTTLSGEEEEGETILDMSEFFQMILHRSNPLCAVAIPHISGNSFETNRGY